MKTRINNILILVFSFSLTLFMVSCKNNKTEHHLLPFEAGEKYQYVNTRGEIVINPQFTDAGLFYEGLAMAGIKKHDESKWGFIDEEGEYVIEPVYNSVTDFSEGIAFVVADTMPPAAINRKGEELF
jgi:hypothetical protein